MWYNIQHRYTARQSGRIVLRFSRTGHCGSRCLVDIDFRVVRSMWRLCHKRCAVAGVRKWQSRQWFKTSGVHAHPSVAAAKNPIRAKGVRTRQAYTTVRYDILLNMIILLLCAVHRSSHVNYEYYCVRMRIRFPMTRRVYTRTHEYNIPNMYTTRHPTLTLRVLAYILYVHMISCKTSKPRCIL